MSSARDFVTSFEDVHGRQTQLRRHYNLLQGGSVASGVDQSVPTLAGGFIITPRIVGILKNVSVMYEGLRRFSEDRPGKHINYILQSVRQMRAKVKEADDILKRAEDQLGEIDTSEEL
jgi:hypothetical protein